LLVFSVNDSTIPTLPMGGITTRWFREAFANGELTGALVRSAVIGAFAAVIATALGIMASIGMSAGRLRLQSLTISVLMLPAVVLGHAVIALPFSILVILPRLRSLDPALGEAARDLGASEMGAFRLVTLPLLTPSLLSSFLICFTTSFDEFAIASFLAPAGSPTYPVFVYTGARTPLLQPEVIAVGSIVVVASLVLVISAELVRRWWEGRLEGRKSDAAPAFAVGA